MDNLAFRRSFLPLLLAIFLLPFYSVAVYAQSPDSPANGTGPLAYDEAEAYAINQMIMCPVCPAETIDQAQVPIARQMRQMVREMLAEGATREEILDFFAQRYGQDILASPPKTGFNLVAWIFPLVGVAAALVAGLLVLRAMSARQPAGLATAPAAASTGSGLEPYLEMVDQGLALESMRNQSDENTSDPASGNVEPQREGGPNNHG